MIRYAEMVEQKKRKEKLKEASDNHNKDLFVDQIERRVNDLKRSLLSDIKHLESSDFDYIQKEYGIDTMVLVLLYLSFEDASSNVKKAMAKLKKDSLKFKINI